MSWGMAFTSSVSIGFYCKRNADEFSQGVGLEPMPSGSAAACQENANRLGSSIRFHHRNIPKQSIVAICIYIYIKNLITRIRKCVKQKSDCFRSKEMVSKRRCQRSYTPRTESTITTLMYSKEVKCEVQKSGEKPNTSSFHDPHKPGARQTRLRETHLRNPAEHSSSRSRAPHSLTKWGGPSELDQVMNQVV